MRSFDTVGLWAEAEDLGLIRPNVSHFKDLKDTFGFDCNQLGCPRTSKRPEKILELILLIREKYSTSEVCGEHLELLGQVVWRENLANSYVRWGRSCYVGGDITLREWLAENGHPYPYHDM